MTYYKTNIQDTENLTEEEIIELYDNGYLLTRLHELHQTRSLRIDLEKFELTSENRRIRKKTEKLNSSVFGIPLRKNPTNWRIHSLGKLFYKQKFDDVSFSASKIRELLNTNKHLFNKLFVYFSKSNLRAGETAATIDHTKTLGYAICYQNKVLLHYSYPFYDLNQDTIPNLGMGMMLSAILSAKKGKLRYVYLGSYTRPTDKYKLQFNGLEWWDGQNWNQSLDDLKKTKFNTKLQK